MHHGTYSGNHLRWIAAGTHQQGHIGELVGTILERRFIHQPIELGQGLLVDVLTHITGDTDDLNPLFRIGVVVDFLRPAVLNDEVLVTAELERLGGATISFKQTIMCGETQLIDATTRVACLDSGTLKPRAIPRDLFVEWREHGQ